MKVSNVGSSIAGMVSNAPLPSIVESLGLSIANAQSALDRNSVETAVAMANTEVIINEKPFNLISLGFAPTFYHFTEANVEAKIAFSMTMERSFSASVGVSANIGIVAASVEASYSQKFSMSASGSSSVAARLVSIPPPEIFNQILDREFRQDVLAPPDPDADADTDTE